MQKLVIVDGDGLLYHSSKETLEESIQSLNERIQNIFDKTKATHYVIFISYTSYFRHKIDPEYKASRTKQKSNLKWLKTLKSYLVENWSAQSLKEVEADDLCAYWINKELYYCKFTNPHSDNHWTISDSTNYADEFSKLEKVLCSPDKDLLQSIEGKHFNYSYKLEDKNNPDSIIKGWWIETRDDDANCFKLYQLMVGDVSDNVKTPFPESAGDWFLKNKMNFRDIVDAYILGFIYETKTGIKKYIKGLGTTNGLISLTINYRLLRLLSNDEDFIREVGELPEFPTITQVPSKVEDKVDDELKF